MHDRLLSGFARHLGAEPDAAALVYYPNARTPTMLSWRELASAATARAAWLRARTQPGAWVFIIDHDPLRQMQWWLGSLLADAVPGILTPPTAKLDLTRYRSELELQLASYPDAIVLYGERVFPVAPEGARFVDVTGWSGEECSEARVARGVTASDAAIFQQSSGTTGIRKGIVLTESAVVNQLRAYSASLRIADDDRIVCWLPLYHDMGLIGCLALAVFAGLPLVLTSPFVWLRSPEWWVRAAHAHRATLSWLPNFAFNLMVDRVSPSAFPPDALAGMRGIINCSEPVLAASLDAFAERFAPLGLERTALSSCYAMAENTFAVTQTPLGRTVAVDVIDPEMLERERTATPRAQGRAFASSGRVLAGTEVRILDGDGRICGEREVGEVAIRSNCMMRGYECIGADALGIGPDGWFRTGDIAYLAEGELYVIGRKKDIIIRAGRNLDPSVFESAVSAVAGIKPGRVVAIGVMSEREGTDDLVIIAEREPAQDELCDDEIRAGILRACEERTGTVPQRIEIVGPGWLAKSSSGKISRAACRAKYAECRLVAK